MVLEGCNFNHTEFLGDWSEAIPGKVVSICDALSKSSSSWVPVLSETMLNAASGIANVQSREPLDNCQASK